MLGAKATAAVGAIGIIGILGAVIFGMWWRGVALKERVKVTSMTAERDSALGVVDTLKVINKDQQKTTDTILGLVRTTQETVNEYHTKLMEADRKTSEAIQALDKMQLTEHYDALAYPLQRGDAARDRLNDIMCRAWGSWADNDPSCRRPEDNGDARTDDRTGDRSGTSSDNPAGSSDHN